jgi:acyl carrier protein
MTQTNALTGHVREIIGRLAPAGAPEPVADARLVEDLGYDSLAVIELALELERELGLPRLQEEEAMDIVTVGQVEALVAGALNHAGGRS